MPPPIPLSVLDLAPIASRLDRGGRAAQQPRPRPARREARLHAPLGRRAPQHAGHRERRDGRRRRPSGGRHLDDPGRRGRDHAAEPLAARDRGAVRHARVALPRPHRPRARTGARHRPAHRARPATRPAERERVPAGRAGPAVPLRAGAARAGDPGRARRRARGPALDPRLEHVRRPARGRARTALRLRLALRTHRPAGGARALPRRVPPLTTARGALRDGRPQRLRGRHRRGGTAALHDAAAVVGEPRSAGCRARIRRRSTTSRRTGRRPRRRRPRRC